VAQVTVYYRHRSKRGEGSLTLSGPQAEMFRRASQKDRTRMVQQQPSVEDGNVYISGTKWTE
jgi:hypothetical protein